MKRPDQRGLASIIIVFTLIIIVALISLGFSRLMNRALQTSVNNQLSAAADFAAQSGINDAVAYVQANPAATADDCDDLIDNGSLQFGGQANADLSGDQLVRYTCVLIEPEPADVVIGDIPPNRSQVVKLTTSAPLNSLMFSWQSGDGSKRDFVSSGQSLLDETRWGVQDYAPLLRISLFPVSPGGGINPGKTFFLYPNDSNSAVEAIGFSSLPTGTKANGNCSTNSSKNPGSFNGAADYDCNTVINVPDLGNGSYYYARLTPIYSAADVKIQGNAAGNAPVKFINVQSVIDVTAKANTVVKRLQGRAQTGDVNNIDANGANMPEDAIRSANTLCKRIIVPDVPDILQIDPGSSTVPECNFLDATLAPNIEITASPNPVQQGQTTDLTWTLVAGDAPTSCTATNNGLPNWSGNKSLPTTTETSDPLNNIQIYRFEITCSNQAGSDTAYVDVDVTPQAPTVTLTADSVALLVGQGTTLRWSTTNNPTTCIASQAWNGPKDPAGGFQPVGPFNAEGSFRYDILCSNAGGNATDSVTITVSSIPPPLPPPGGSCPSPVGGGPGNGTSDPCVRSITAGWSSDGSYAYFNIYVDHCYGGITVNYPGGSISIGWPGGQPPNGDNIYLSFTAPSDGPIPSSSGGTVTVTCYGNTNFSYQDASLGAQPGGSPIGCANGAINPPACNDFGGGGGTCPSNSADCGQQTIGGCDWGDGAYDADISSGFCDGNGGVWSAWCRTYSISTGATVSITKGGC